MSSTTPAACLRSLAMLIGLSATLPAQDAWVGLDVSRSLLEQAMLQQREPELWSDVRETVRLSEQSLAAVESTFDDELGTAIAEALVAISSRQDATEAHWAELSVAADDAERAAADARWQAAAGSIARRLLVSEGAIPETNLLASELFFDADLDADGTAALRRGLARWPDSALLHDQLRAWKHRITNTEGFMVAFEARAATLGSRSPQSVGLALESSAAIYEELALRAYDVAQADGDPAAYRDAARYFEAAARDARKARAISRQPSQDDVAAQRAQALVNAGWAHYAVAQRAWFDGDRESPEAWSAVERAYTDFLDALKTEPGNRSAEVALTSLGTLVGTKGQEVDPLTLGSEDMADIRDYFGDLAPRFEIAEWWNNFALFSRDTGVAEAAAGNDERAMELWEQSYAAYEKAIAIDDGDARMTNDTGLMLLYHLERDLERAEMLFERAWKLGREACENPFADPESFEYQSDFGGYTDAMLNLALLAARKGDLERASTVIDELVSISPERPDALGLKAQIDGARARADG